MNFREKGKMSFHVHGKVMISMFSSLFLASISRKGKVFTERVLAKQQFPLNLLYSHSLCLSRGLAKRSLFFFFACRDGMFNEQVKQRETEFVQLDLGKWHSGMNES